MKLSWICVLKMLLISFLISSLLHATPDITPISPARGIYIPIFNGSNLKMYEIAGSRGTMCQDGSLNIENVVLDSFENFEEGKKRWTISSNSANILRAKHVVYGSGPVLIEGGNFTAVATDWKFFYEDRKFIADKNIKVLFEEDTVKFLAP